MFLIFFDKQFNKRDEWGGVELPIVLFLNL